MRSRLFSLIRWSGFQPILPNLPNCSTPLQTGKSNYILLFIRPAWILLARPPYRRTNRGHGANLSPQQNFDFGMPVGYSYTISNGKLGQLEPPFANPQILMSFNWLLYGSQAGIGSSKTSFKVCLIRLPMRYQSYFIKGESMGISGNRQLAGLRWAQGLDMLKSICI